MAVTRENENDTELCGHVYDVAILRSTDVFVYVIYVTRILPRI